MKTIVPAKENIAKLWGHPKPKEDVQYRPMKYLLKTQVEDGTLVHNVVTGHLVLLSAEESEAYEKLPAAYAPILNELIANHFVVPEAFDEHKSVLQLKTILRKAEDSKPKHITGYTILPTTNCNARCFYCYEANTKHINMTEETALRTVEFIKENCGGDKVSIGWFGGEPTVAANRIDFICNGLKEAGIEYSSTMISNGYLLNAEMADRAKDLWKLRRIQITLDGTEEVYNKVKAYRAVKGSPFRTVMANITSLLEREISVSVRMNLDRHNAENLRELIEELTERFSGNSYFDAYVWPLFDDCGFEPVGHTDDDRHWLLEKQAELNEILRKNQMNRSRRERALPSIKFHHCMADNDGSVIINADGSLAKCEHTFMDEIVGNIYDGITDKACIASWKENVEYSECKECPLFPTCYEPKKCFSTGSCSEEKRKADKQDAIIAVSATYAKWKTDIIKE